MALADFNKKTEKGLVTGGWKLAFHSLCSGEEKSRLVIQRLHDANHLPLGKTKKQRMAHGQSAEREL